MDKLAKRFPVAALLVLLFCLPLLPLSKYQLHIINLVAVSAILAMSLDLLFGFLGQLSLAHASFYGVGAYVASLLTISGDLPFWGATPVAMVACAVLGALLGAPAMRLTGFYLAMATMAFGVIVSTLLVQSVSITGGPNGLPEIPPPQLFGIELIGPQRGVIGNYYYLLLVSALLVYIFLRRVTSGRTGRTIAAVRESALAAASVGVNVRSVQVLVFAVSCALAGLAGSLYAHLILYISPETFTVTNSLVALLGVVLGGIGTLWGPVIGAGLLTVLGEVTRNFGSYQLLMYAVAIILVIQVVPHGISGLLLQLRRPKRNHEPLVPDDARETVVLPRGERINGGVLLRAEDVSKRFGGLKALDQVSFDVKSGEIKALIGPNGSGKTTLFNCLSGFDTPNAGTVCFGGNAISGWPAHRIARAGMARSFQIVQLFGQSTVKDTLLLAGQRRHPASVLSVILGTSGSHRADEENSRAADALLAEAGLWDVRDQISSTLPYGLQRILEIARAVATVPRLILLDEPAAGLNTGEAFQLAAYLRRVRDRGVTVLIVEHNMAFVLGLADSAIVLDRGQKIAEGTPSEIRGDRAVIGAYLGAPLNEARHA